LQTLTCPAPVKLNLFLHIIGRRANGYHNLQTVFQFLDYCDELHFTRRDDGQIHCHSTEEALNNPQDLSYRAACLLQQHSGTTWGADIQVNKQIPMGGGLGGGSSDAATTLLALNQLWQLDLPLSELARLGLQLGADVPIFIHGHAAWAEGVGEEIQAVTLEEPWYLVLHPNVAVPTAEIFSAKNLTRDMAPIRMPDFLAGRCINVCETVVRQLYPAVDEAFNWLNQYRLARLTGTGACLFARFEEQAEALAVQESVPDYWSSFVAQANNLSAAHRRLQQVVKK